MHGGLENSNAGALAQMGLEILIDAPEPVEVWPENWQAVEVFDALGTQWAVAPSGKAIGLRYEAMPLVMRIHAVAPADRRQVFEDVRVMENAVLTMINKRP